MKYKVLVHGFHNGPTYCVVDAQEYEEKGPGCGGCQHLFEGSLADCEAWIRLTDGGYL